VLALLLTTGKESLGPKHDRNAYDIILHFCMVADTLIAQNYDVVEPFLSTTYVPQGQWTPAPTFRLEFGKALKKPLFGTLFGCFSGLQPK
jgi:hypothetical protein